MTEVSIRRLTKAHIIDLRNIVKPHHLVEKVLNMVCILRGSIAPNWTMAREMMNSMTFKLELVLLDASKIKPSLMKRVIKILNNFHRHLTPDVSLEYISFFSRIVTFFSMCSTWPKSTKELQSCLLGSSTLSNGTLVSLGTSST